MDSDSALKPFCLVLGGKGSDNFPFLPGEGA